MKRPEVLSPAGSAPSMVAAVQCGADAIYLGAGDFNARRGADNFGGELDAATAYCHARGVKAYAALNTMVRQDELSRLEATIEEICRAGIDGVIVQDIGVARILRRMAPTLPLHASTQMAVHNPQGVDLLVENGFSRVVLARELEYADIARCANRGAELEVFVHGALCVSCSGQCLLSSMIGGRSGNRGMCAQPCRMKYRMDGREGYLLSTKDLCGLEGLSALIEAGADSLKIEGRLKRPEYVAQTTGVYRRAVDALASGERFDRAKAEAELAQMFNRGGFTRGYGFGAEESELMYPERPNHIGVEIGKCRKNGEVELRTAVDAKDALVLRRSGSDDLPVRLPDAACGTARLPDARRGDVLVRLVSQAQMRAAQESFAGEKKKFPVDIRLTLHTGEAAALEMFDGAHRVRCEGDAVQAAQNRPADPARIRAQVEKLGDTPFSPRAFEAEIDANAYLSVSALNALRRGAAESLLAARFGAPHDCARIAPPMIEAGASGMPELLAQSADPQILRRALNAGADFAVYAPNDLRPQALNDMLDRLPDRFDLALPPVTSERALNAIYAWTCANAARVRRVYVANIGQIQPKWPAEVCGDALLNIANAFSVEQLREWKLSAYTPSLELNRAQIDALGGRRQLIVYGRVPLMQLRHCPLRAAKDMKGKHRDCAHCDRCAPEQKLDHRALTDRTNAVFPLRRIAAPDGCVVQLLNSARLMLLRRAAALPSSAAWRLLLDADDPIEAVVRLHRAAMRGEDVRGDADWPLLSEMNTTTGHYFRGAE